MSECCIPIEEMTYEKWAALKSLDMLPRGKHIAITNADESLYGGTRVVLFCPEVNQVSENGTAKFHTPKYDQTVAGFTMYNAEGTYVVDQKVIWGGKHWKNLSGNTGSATDMFTLDSEWEEIPFNDTDYNVTVAPIKFDFTNNLIVGRDEIESDCSVRYSKEGNLPLGFGNPIKCFQWGNPFNYGRNKGIGSQHIIDGINININFRGAYQTNFEVSNGGYQIEATFETDTYQDRISLKNGARQNILQLKAGAYQKNVNLDNYAIQDTLIIDASYQENIWMNNGAMQNSLTLSEGGHQKNISNDGFQMLRSGQASAGLIEENKAISPLGSNFPLVTPAEVGIEEILVVDYPYCGEIPVTCGDPTATVSKIINDQNKINFRIRPEVGKEITFQGTEFDEIDEDGLILLPGPTAVVNGSKREFIEFRKVSITVGEGVEEETFQVFAFVSSTGTYL